VTGAALGHPRDVRLLHLVVCALAISACTATSLAVARPAVVVAPAPDLSCAARQDSTGVNFQISVEADARELTRWCRAVGGPVLVETPAVAATAMPPALDELAVISWNAHLAEGQLDALIAKLKSGALTDGKPVQHFVLLSQELYRRGDAVPEFDAANRSAYAIRPRDPDVADINGHAASLGLSIFYAPSMRNGPELREDRGNAIISTEPLIDPIALELPLARQRRVTLGAAVHIRTDAGIRRLELVDAHLEPLSSPKTLWVFKNPREAQARAILDLLDEPRYTDRARTFGVIVGGDFNTVRDGADESAIHLLKVWSSGEATEDPRDTHMMGRLDYLFFNLPDGWNASTQRLDERFGSDHHPVLGTFSR
jgi:endonuclease/exonuclease/phosphatase family metal-dependent hydrolase